MGRFKLKTSSLRQAASGDTIYFAGEAINKGNVAAGGIQIAISLLDDKGNVAASGSYNRVSLDVVPANGKYPFYVPIDKAPASWKEVKIQIQARPYTEGFIFRNYLDLKLDKIVPQPPKSQYDKFGLSGQVSNTGKKGTTLVEIVAVAYDSDGKVIDAGHTFSKLDRIDPGGDSPFQLTFENIKTAPAKYELFVQGDEVSN